MSEENQQKVDAFNQHLDECAQCEAHPFDLCAEGDRLIQLTLPVL